jgi:hypothetical protein
MKSCLCATKLGCNTVACHAAAEGKGPLRVSALGTDPVTDYAAIVEQPEYPLINKTIPKASALLTNPSGKIATSCPLVMPTNSTAYGVLLSWIEKGAKRME